MKMFYIVTINGKIIAFQADEVESDDDRHSFKMDGEVVGEFERKNIAGYFWEEMGEEDEDY